MRKRVQLVFGDEKTLTKQSFKDDCDVNQILTKWIKTGQPPESKAPMRYGDYTSVEEYHASCQRVIDAQASFDALPSKVRTRFRNDPAEFLGYMSEPITPERFQFLKENGLIRKSSGSYTTDVKDHFDIPERGPGDVSGGA